MSFLTSVPLKYKSTTGKEIRKNLTTWRLINMPLKTSGSMRKSRTILRNASRQMIMKLQPQKNLWDAAKVVLRGKFIAI